MSEFEPKYIVGITRQLEYAGDPLSLDAMRHIFYQNKEAASLDKRIAELEAQVKQIEDDNKRLREANEWRTMDDAPTNQNILIYDRESNEVNIGHFVKGWKEWWIAYTEKVIYTPTLWAYLPEPPKEQNS